MRGVKGMPDILCEDVKKYCWIEKQVQKILFSYCFEEMRLPILEKKELFSRGVGEGCDIVQKEMYLLEDRKGDFLALRPEGTAGVVRSVIEHKLYAHSELLKLFYCGPMFRYERPQSGRQRQFYQLGAELFGDSSISSDFELIRLFWDIAQALNIPQCVLKLNTLGGSESKKRFQSILRQKVQEDLSLFCSDCHQRYELNVLRMLDCKNMTCQDQLNSYNLSLYACLSDEEHRSFDHLCSFLKDFSIPFVHEENLVRGLDYYMGVVFELESHVLEGSHKVIGAGGRYDNLVKSLGGPFLPAIGFAFGLERLYLASSFCSSILEPSREGVFFVFFDASLRMDLQLLIHRLRVEKNQRVSWDLSGQRSVKSQMRLASKNRFKYVCLYGEDEKNDQKITIKNLEDSTQITVPIENILKSVI